MSDPLDLDAIECRIRDCSTYNFGLRNADRLAKEDAPALLAALKEARAGLADAWESGLNSGINYKIALLFIPNTPKPTNPYLDRTETP